MCCINQDNKSPPYGEHCSCYSIDESKKSQNLMNRLNNNKWEEEQLEGKKKPKKKNAVICTIMYTNDPSGL